jgi:hypothetical protein
MEDWFEKGLPGSPEQWEQRKRRQLETAAYEFCGPESQKEWAFLPEKRVEKILRLWLQVNSYTEHFQIWVDPTSSHRYILVPVWKVELWTRDNKNVYRLDP